jgi:DedD protein
MEETDAQLLIKKRARRRLVGAVAFVSVVALVLPMVMDHQPRQAVQDVEIRIPGQDEKSFAPKFAAPPDVSDEKPAEKAPEAARAPVAVLTAKVIEANRDKPVDKPEEKTVPKVAEKALPKPPEKPQAKVEKPDKVVDKSLAKETEAQRAAAILGGQAAAPAAKANDYLVLIGAFSNESNVKILKEKLGQLGIKTFSEPLETPQGKKTRVRAGPFSSREAAENALVKMQSIGVSGVVSAK